MKPIILTLGDDDIAQLVRDIDFEVFDSDSGNAFYSAIIVDTRAQYKDKALEIIKHIRVHENSKILAFAFTEEHLAADQYRKLIELGFDGCFDQSTPKEIIVARLGSSIRIKNMQDEAKIRFKTLKSLDPDTFEYNTNTSKPNRVLLFGSPGPQNLEISALLDNLNINYVAAMTSFMAFEYLHRGQFDGIIIFAENDSKSALSFVSGLRRNSRLYHIPCTVFMNEDFGDASEILKIGASDANFFGINNELAIARFLTLIDEQRRRESLSIAFAMTRTVKVADALTGLYNKHFFYSHLESLIKNIGVYNQNLSIGFIKVSIPKDLKPDEIRRVITQTGSMVSRLIRTEDTAARIDDDTFAILCPATSEHECKIALHRIAAVLETSAYDTGSTKPVMISTSQAAFALAPAHTIDEVKTLAQMFIQERS